jgi:hypothetical protein
LCREASAPAGSHQESFADGQLFGAVCFWVFFIIWLARFLPKQLQAGINPRSYN